MLSDQHALERDKTARQKALASQKQSISVEEEEEEDDPFAEFAWVTGHDVDAPDEDNGDSDGSIANTLKVVATVSDSVSQKRRRGAPKMQKQKRVSCTSVLQKWRERLDRNFKSIIGFIDKLDNFSCNTNTAFL